MEKGSIGSWDPYHFYMPRLREKKVSREIHALKKPIFKFPTTPHLAVLENSSIRNDKVMTAEERHFFLSIK